MKITKTLILKISYKKHIIGKKEKNETIKKTREGQK